MLEGWGRIGGNTESWAGPDWSIVLASREPHLCHRTPKGYQGKIVSLLISAPRAFPASPVHDQRRLSLSVCPGLRNGMLQSATPTSFFFFCTGV
jgi:hypothetical protein